MKCYAISEHVEKGGVHSGDATLILPSVNLSAEDKARVKEATVKVAEALNINGCYNAQFLLCPGMLHPVPSECVSSIAL